MDKIGTYNRTNTIKVHHNALDITSVILGKTMPQSLEHECVVLGSMIIEKNATEMGLESLKEECFYKEAHRYIFKSMVNLFNKKVPIDMPNVVEELKGMEKLDYVGGAQYLTHIAEDIATTANIESWVKIILEKFTQREMIRVSKEIIADSYQPDADALDLINSAESKLFAIANNFIKKNYKKISEALGGVMERIETIRTQKSALTGVTTGFKNLNYITNGWQKTDLIVLAARPGAGKTAFALNLALYAAMDKINPVPVAFFSLEMSIGQLIERALSAESEIKLDDIKKGKLEGNKLDRLYSKGVEPLSKAPIYIDDTSSINIFELRSKCKKLVSNNNVGLIIIDYLQLMSGSDNKMFNREQEISKISRELKSLAKEVDVPIIALSQLNRNTENRSDRKPMLSDLRESGAIEQDADMVILLYRPDYYQIEQNEKGEDIKGKVECIIAKHRNGELGVVDLRAFLEIQKFVDWNDGVITRSSSMNTLNTNINDSSINNTYINDSDDAPF